MPYKDPDPTDPHLLIGVLLPAQAETMRDMAYVFAEEFARLGYPREELLRLFKNPFYGGAHGAYRALGEEQTVAIIDECIDAWGGLKVSVQDVQAVQPLTSGQAPSSIQRHADEKTDGRLNHSNLSDAKKFDPDERSEQDA